MVEDAERFKAADEAKALQIGAVNDLQEYAGRVKVSASKSSQWLSPAQQQAVVDVLGGIESWVIANQTMATLADIQSQRDQLESVWVPIMTSCTNAEEEEEEGGEEEESDAEGGREDSREDDVYDAACSSEGGDRGEIQQSSAEDEPADQEPEKAGD